MSLQYLISKAISVPSLKHDTYGKLLCGIQVEDDDDETTDHPNQPLLTRVNQTNIDDD